MNIYVVVDVDSDDIYTFLNKKNAVIFMYHKCRSWGAILYTYENGNDVSLSALYKTEEEKLNFLFSCPEDKINNIFESYWIYEETIPEDDNEKR